MNQFLKTSVFLMSSALLLGSCSDENSNPQEPDTVSYTHLTLPTNSLV